jgi:biotin synthase-related radical SAM superfamily protein
MCKSALLTQSGQASILYFEFESFEQMIDSFKFKEEEVMLDNQF